tara:strand:+ start:616 stop:888 length:273 start_codon:yes stop_codon:yes gene_type:complete
MAAVAKKKETKKVNGKAQEPSAPREKVVSIDGGRRPTHRLKIGSPRGDGGTWWSEVGAAWEYTDENGQSVMSIKVLPGVSVSGNLKLFPA